MRAMARNGNLRETAASTVKTVEPAQRDGDFKSSLCRSQFWLYYRALSKALQKFGAAKF